MGDEVKCVLLCVCVCVRACACVCVRVRMRVWCRNKSDLLAPSFSPRETRIAEDFFVFSFPSVMEAPAIFTLKSGFPKGWLGNGLDRLALA